MSVLDTAVTLDDTACVAPHGRPGIGIPETRRISATLSGGFFCAAWQVQ
ncbi:hypothetical protein [uncultured Thiocystis sp.]|jgi:hypothetical protein|nr:hypothetical protein [uncultured Thiocystis sp.]